MKYKLAISDFDGTLLRDDDTISPRTVSAIKNFLQNGGVFTVATGRMIRSIHARLPDLGLGDIPIPLMGHQGALVIDSVTGEELIRKDLSNDSAIALVKECIERGLYVQIYVDPERLLVAKYDKISEAYHKATRIRAEEVGCLVQYLQRTRVSCNKILAVADPDKSLDIMRQLESKYPDIMFSISHPTFVEMVNGESGKGNAARFVARRMGIGMDEVVGFGDSINDISLIGAVGRGIAVANARDELKAVADEVSQYTNNQDCVARVLEEIVRG